MTTRHMYDFRHNDASAPLCRNLLTGGAVVRQIITNVNCPACLDLWQRAQTVPSITHGTLMPSIHDRFFKDWSVELDNTSGNVEAPTGWFGLGELFESDKKDWCQSNEDWLSVEAIQPGWYFVIIDNNGLVWSFRYEDPALCAIDFEARDRAYMAWEAGNE